MERSRDEDCSPIRSRDLYRYREEFHRGSLTLPPLLIQDSTPYLLGESSFVPSPLPFLGKGTSPQERAIPLLDRSDPTTTGWAVDARLVIEIDRTASDRETLPAVSARNTDVSL